MYIKCFFVFILNLVFPGRTIINHHQLQHYCHNLFHYSKQAVLLGRIQMLCGCYDVFRFMGWLLQHRLFLDLKMYDFNVHALESQKFILVSGIYYKSQSYILGCLTSKDTMYYFKKNDCQFAYMFLKIKKYFFYWIYIQSSSNSEYI